MDIDTNGFEIEDVVRDKITGFEGKITGMSQYATGCARAVVQPRMDPTREKLPEAYAIDVLTLEMVEAGPRHVAQPSPELVGAKRGGPPSLAPRRLS